EEVAVGAGSVIDRLLQRHRRHLTQPRPFGGLLRQRRHSLRRLGEGHVLVQSRPVEAVAFGDKVVEHHPTRPEGARQHPHLTPSGVGAIPVPLQRHALYSSAAAMMVSGLVFFTARFHALRAWPSSAALCQASKNRRTRGALVPACSANDVASVLLRRSRLRLLSRLSDLRSPP